MLRELEGWDPVPYQWAAAGYEGAIASGSTTCGLLIGAAIFLGFYHGRDAAGAPKAKDKRRRRAVRAVNALYREFAERFGPTDCRTLTGCDWSKKEDINRYYREKVFLRVCFPQLEHVLRHCLQVKTGET